MTFSAFMLILALVLFVLAAINVPSSRFNLTAAGLACAMAASLFGGGGIFGG